MSGGQNLRQTEPLCVNSYTDLYIYICLLEILFVDKGIIKLYARIILLHKKNLELNTKQQHKCCCVTYLNTGFIFRACIISVLQQVKERWSSDICLSMFIRKYYNMGNDKTHIVHPCSEVEVMLSWISLWFRFGKMAMTEDTWQGPY